MNEGQEAIYKRMQTRLAKFNISLRRGLQGKVFYAVVSSGEAYSQNYAIRWSEAVQAWICNPVSGDSDEAKRILRIALGEVDLDGRSFPRQNPPEIQP